MELPTRIFGVEYVYQESSKRPSWRNKKRGLILYKEFGTASGAIKSSMKLGGADGGRLYVGKVIWTLAAEHGEV